ncbi:hypothetical protein AVEN_216448-1 [Araneus ventricosus]|uniref:Uncharacterized protein n=1 Tax=Araneus ventricosus TaxID=182803 RepID=A0A4Y2BLJ8_ARAVE|nr:hypothetical protein AVEN_216448-1 [Araneus ventricosus]
MPLDNLLLQSASAIDSVCRKHSLSLTLTKGLHNLVTIVISVAEGDACVFELHKYYAASLRQPQQKEQVDNWDYNNSMYYYNEDQYYQDYENKDKFFGCDGVTENLDQQDESEIVCEDEELREELELMKSMGLPTSFGTKSRHKEKKQDLAEDEQDDNQNNYEPGVYFENGVDEYYENGETNTNDIAPKYDPNSLERNQEWQSYWERNGESIILNSWIQKYKDYINPEYLKDAFPLASLNVKLGNTSELNHINNRLQTMNFVDSSNQEKENSNDLALQSMDIAEDDNVEDNIIKSDVVLSETDILKVIDYNSDSPSIKEENALSGCDPELIEGVKQFSEKYETEEYDVILNTTPKKDYDNMFSLRVKLEEPIEAIPTTDEAWDDLWMQHRQEQYDQHYKYFTSHYRVSLNRCSSSEKSNETLDSDKCEECGRKNCIFCGSKVDENELLEELSLTADKMNNDTSRAETNGENGIKIENVLELEIFADDDDSENSILSTGENLDKAAEESLKMELSDNEAPSEEPIKLKRDHASDSDEDAPPDQCIKDLGFVVKPAISLKIKSRRKRRKTKRQSKRRCPFEMIKKTTPEESSKESEECTDSNAKDEEKCAKSTMKEEDCDASEDVPNENGEVEFNPNSDEFKKYWAQRYRLFSLFDEGIKLDKGGELSDGWKWGCHRLMLLDVSMCLTLWSNDSGININLKILCPEDMFQANNDLQKAVFSFSPKEKKHYCAAAHCRPVCSIREKYLCSYGAKTPSQWTTEKGPLMLGKKTRFLDQTAMGFCTLHRRVQIHTGE